MTSLWTLHMEVWQVSCSSRNLSCTICESLFSDVFSINGVLKSAALLQEPKAKTSARNTSSAPRGCDVPSNPSAIPAPWRLRCRFFDRLLVDSAEKSAYKQVVVFFFWNCSWSFCLTFVRCFFGVKNWNSELLFEADRIYRQFALAWALARPKELKSAFSRVFFISEKRQKWKTKKTLSARNILKELDSFGTYSYGFCSAWLLGLVTCCDDRSTAGDRPGTLQFPLRTLSIWESGNLFCKSSRPL